MAPSNIRIIVSPRTISCSSYIQRDQFFTPGLPRLSESGLITAYWRSGLPCCCVSQLLVPPHTQNTRVVRFFLLHDALSQLFITSSLIIEAPFLLSVPRRAWFWGLTNISWSTAKFSVVSFS